ncbi:MAG: hypothetical protein IJ934_02520 [Acetobacter sp.]|nr:hypothetical protein [Acetobacter sp.]
MLCLNAGRLYVAKQMMQNSVDAAAEAISSTQGASCSNIPWYATQVAQLFVAVNFERQSRWVTGYDATGYFGTKVNANNISFGGGGCDSYGRVPVQLYAQVPVWLGGFLGQKSVTIMTQAFATFDHGSIKKGK